MNLKQVWRAVGILPALIILIILFIVSLAYGYTETNLKTVYQTFTNYDPRNEAHSVIMNMRLPRAVIAVLVGASLAVSGALMQALTRNPMASPGILGINAGASLAIVLGVTFFSVSSLYGFMWFSFTGALIAAVSVYILGSIGREGLTPLKLTMAGIVLSSLFSAITTSVLVLNESTLDNVLYWLAGSVEGRSLSVVGPTLPFVIIGIFVSMTIGRQINALLVGEDVAKGLGQRTWLVKTTGLIIVVLLSGSAVAMAGPIGFIGLIIPHVTRGLIGIDHRWVFPYAALFGAALLLASDILARFILFPQEVPVGVTTAVIGAPFFIYLARKGVMKG